MEENIKSTPHHFDLTIQDTRLLINAWRLDVLSFDDPNWSWQVILDWENVLDSMENWSYKMGTVSRMRNLDYMLNVVFEKNGLKSTDIVLFNSDAVGGLTPIKEEFKLLAEMEEL